VIFAAFMTLPHLSASDLMKSRNSSGELVVGVVCNSFQFSADCRISLHDNRVMSRNNVLGRVEQEALDCARLPLARLNVRLPFPISH
jgi:hypothetical protein